MSSECLTNCHHNFSICMIGSWGSDVVRCKSEESKCRRSCDITYNEITDWDLPNKDQYDTMKRSVNKENQAWGDFNACQDKQSHVNTNYPEWVDSKYGFKLDCKKMKGMPVVLRRNRNEDNERNWVDCNGRTHKKEKDSLYQFRTPNGDYSILRSASDFNDFLDERMEVSCEDMCKDNTEEQAERCREQCKSAWREQKLDTNMCVNESGYTIPLWGPRSGSENPDPNFTVDDLKEGNIFIDSPNITQALRRKLKDMDDKCTEPLNNPCNSRRPNRMK